MVQAREVKGESKRRNQNLRGKQRPDLSRGRSGMGRVRT